MAPRLQTGPCWHLNFLTIVEASSVGKLRDTVSARGLGWSSCVTNPQRYRTRWREHRLSCIRAPCASCDGALHVIFRLLRSSGPGVVSPPFLPRDRAIVKSVAYEAVSLTKLPLKCQSASDLSERAPVALDWLISPSTVWRVPDTKV